MQGWVKQAEELRSLGISKVVFPSPSDVDKSDFKKMFLKTVIGGSSPEAVRMRELQQIVKRRLIMSDPIQKELNQLTDNLSEEFYNITNKKFSLK